MKVDKLGRFAPHLYALALCLSVGLSVLSFHWQNSAVAKLQDLYQKDNQYSLWLNLEKAHQAKVNALTKGLLNKRSLWKKEYDKALLDYRRIVKSIGLDPELSWSEEVESLKENNLKSMVALLKKQKRRIALKIYKEESGKIKEKEEILKAYTQWTQLIQFYSWGSSTFFFFMMIFYQRSKAIRKKLRKERIKRDFMLDSMDSALFILDKEKRVLGVNEKVKQLWKNKGPWVNVVDESLENPHIKDFFPVIFEKNERGELENKSFEDSQFETLLRPGIENSAMRFQIQLKSLSAQPIWFQIDSKTYQQELTLISLTEITELIGAMELINKQQESLIHQSKMSALGRLSGGMAHEINNPLAIISSEAEDLLDIAEDEGAVSEEEARNISVNIKSTTDRISQIIKGLKIFSHQEGSGEEKEVVIKELMEELLGLSQESLKAKGIDFLVKYSLKDESCFLMGNKVQIIQVMVNLINNAIDALEEMNKKEIKITISEVPDSFLFTFQDSGPGIPPSLTKKIFDPFFTTKDVGKGTGLGLSLSQSIMKAHKGEMSLVESDSGATFVLSFPKPFDKERKWAS